MVKKRLKTFKDALKVDVVKAKIAELSTLRKSCSTHKERIIMSS